MNIHNVILKLYPNVTHIIGNIAYDVDNNEVAYDKAAVEAKAIEMQAEEAAKQKESLDKLAALGLTPDDLKRILG